MKLYKFFKVGCSPCGTLAKIMNMINLPGDIELVEINVSLEENREMVEKYAIDKVPALIFEDGRRMDGVKPKRKVEAFIFGGNDEISD